MRPVHFEILADNPEKVADFYRKALGWEITTWEGPQMYWLINTGPDNAAGINGGIMRREFAQPVINTIGVESLQETLKKVRAAGGKTINEPSEIPGIGLHVYCADPEGNMFGLLQPAMK